jgi:hypothetical protein
MHEQEVMKMIDSRSRCSLIRWSLLCAALIALPPIARAQQEQDRVPGNELAREPGAPLPLEADAAPMTQQQFNEWAEQSVFSSDGNAIAWRLRLSERLELKLDYLGRTCGITEAQTKKLRLAGNADIKRLLDRLDADKRSFAFVKDDSAEIAKLQSDVQELRDTSASSFLEEGSLFAKTLQKSLSREQLAKYSMAARQSKQFRHQAMVDQTVQLFDVAVGISDAERERFAQLLLRRTRPARSSRGPLSELLSVGFQAAKLPEAEVKPIFDNSQWHLLRTLFQEFIEGGQPEGVVLDTEIAGASPHEAAGPVAPPGTTAEQKNQ